MKGFYLIDKPIGISSFGVIKYLRKITGIKKIGHTGTLDPLASGGLLVALGEYTKLIPYFEKDFKEYEFTINLDGITASLDLETPVDFLDAEKKNFFQQTLCIEEIGEILKKHFLGKISQMPPKYSAKKIDGKKALVMVRKNQDFQLKPVEVEIFSIDIINFSYPSLTLKARVSAGTYIRSIAKDLGEILGCGGYITYLRRTGVGKLDISLAQNIDVFDLQKFLLPEVLFGEENILLVDEKKRVFLDRGNPIQYENEMEEQKVYFVKKSTFISNIVSYKEGFLYPLRKI